MTALPSPGRPYCGSRHRRATRPHLRVRHLHGQVVLVARRQPPASLRTPGARLLVLAFLVLVAGVGALLAVPDLTAAPPGGPCPARVSRALTDGHGTLRIRAEETHSTTLVHLCADPDLGPVRAWAASHRLGALSRSIPVQAVGRSLALIAVTDAAEAALTLRLRLESGEHSTFVISIG
ncbi:hypothetical protein OHA21_17990 [Actinoplanes sp. NBC_00393]|uniref:hypothetical protein n=1 Tax=Actinoplanes sp. NBC_00393 TaxID=2975953 RepID=UPI002E22592B